VEAKERCKKILYRDWSPYRCKKAAVRDGFCSVHHPESIADKSKKLEEKWEAESRERRKHEKIATPIPVERIPPHFIIKARKWAEEGAPRYLIRRRLRTSMPVVRAILGPPDYHTMASLEILQQRSERMLANPMPHDPVTGRFLKRARGDRGGGEGI